MYKKSNRTITVIALILTYNSVVNCNEDFDYSVKFNGIIYNDDNCNKLPISIIDDNYSCKCNENNICFDKYFNSSFKKLSFNNKNLEQSCNFSFTNTTNINICLKCNGFSINYNVIENNYCYGKVVIIGIVFCIAFITLCVCITVIILIYSNKIKKQHNSLINSYPPPPDYNAL